MDGLIPKLQAAMHSIPGQPRLRPRDAALPSQQVVGQRRLALPNSYTHLSCVSACLLEPDGAGGGVLWSAALLDVLYMHACEQPDMCSYMHACMHACKYQVHEHAWKDHMCVQATRASTMQMYKCIILCQHHCWVGNIVYRVACINTLLQ